jgi:ubiquinone/menaquinone biosynthesis C-methylase UbiE
MGTSTQTKTSRCLRQAALSAGVAVAASLAVSAVLAARRLYDRRTRDRVPSAESLDDAGVTRAFDRISRLPHMHLMRRWIARRVTQRIPQGQVLDLGCGPGYLALELARGTPELEIVGVDLSEEMLDRADHLASMSGLGDRVSFRKGDAQQIPLPDGSVDGVISTLSLHHWRDPPSVFDEIYRILRPGGYALILDLRRDMRPLPWLLIWFVTRAVVPEPLRRINEPLGSRNAAYTPDEAAELLQSAHFAGGRVTPGPLWLIVETARNAPA